MSRRAWRWITAGVVLIVVATALGFFFQQQHLDDEKTKLEHVCRLSLANRLAIHIIIVELEGNPLITPEQKGRLAQQDERVQEQVVALAACI